jgi:hypothetical protein
MQNTHTLYINRANADHVFEFITKTPQVLFNCNWQMQAPYDEPRTHNVYCDVKANNLDAARDVLARIADQMGMKTDWQLIPNKI